MIHEVRQQDDPRHMADSIIKILRDFPTESFLDDHNFRNLFREMIVINIDRLIFILGSKDMDKIPYSLNAIPISFIDSYRHEVRAITTVCYFGIFINKIKEKKILLNALKYSSFSSVSKGLLIHLII